MPLSAGTRLGPYEITGSLGAGGMGEVYKARDTRLDRTVAIKILSASLARDHEFRARFDREARAISQLDHPHICALYDVGTHDGTAYLVMQYLEGETLAARLERGALPLDQALEYGIQIADALTKAHRAGIVHRDLKPGNIMLTKSGARLLDFGLAKHAASSSQAGGVSLPTTLAGLTAQGTILGTFQYMAPEQIEGAEADARSDIWAFGCVMYEMLTGAPPFTGKSYASLIANIMSAEPPPVRTLQPLTPPLLDHVVRRCLAKNADERWQSAADLAGELQWIAKGLDALASAGTSTTRLRIWQAAGALATAAVVGLLVLLVTSRRPGPVSVSQVMFTVSPPEGATFVTPQTVVGLPWMALAPDGRTLAFVAMSSDGREQLWLRPLGGTTATPLAATDGARAPFWSPDSRYVAFLAEGKLKYTDTTGSLQQVIADVQGNGFGGAWNSQNVVVFTSHGLHKIVVGQRATEAPLTRIDPSKGQFLHGWPVFLPDERHFVYTITKPGSPFVNEVWIGSIDGSESRQLTTSMSSALYAAPGYLLYTAGSATVANDRALMAQRFDTSRLQLTGDPIRIADSVGANGPSGYTAVSVSTAGVLVYGAAVTNDAQIAWRDRKGQPVESLELTHAWAPALSSDGTLLALEHALPQTGMSVWTYDLKRKMLQRLVFDSSIAPIFSPDGRYIAYTARRNGHLDQLFRKATGGAGEEQLIFEKPGSFATDWTADGRFIIVQGANVNSRSDLWMVNLADLKAQPLMATPYAETYGAVSRDGRWLAYSSAKSGAMEVYVRQFPAGDREWLISHGGAEPRWRRDGRELFYVSSDRRLMSVPVRNSRTFDPGESRPLFEMNLPPLTVPSGRRRYAVAPDGQSFFITELTSRNPSPPLTVIVNWAALLTKPQ